MKESTIKLSTFKKLKSFLLEACVYKRPNPRNPYGFSLVVNLIPLPESNNPDDDGGGGSGSSGNSDEGVLEVEGRSARGLLSGGGSLLLDSVLGLDVLGEGDLEHALELLDLVGRSLEGSRDGVVLADGGDREADDLGFQVGSLVADGVVAELEVEGDVDASGEALVASIDHAVSATWAKLERTRIRGSPSPSLLL